MNDEGRYVNIGVAVGGAVLVAAVAFGGGVLIGSKQSIASPAFAAAFLAEEPPAGVDLSPVWRTWRAIDQGFVPTGALASTTASSTPTGFEDPQERVWGMIQGLTASLGDPYTVFLPPEDTEIFEDDISGAFEGVGMEIGIRDSVLTVVSPLKDTPAYRAGLKAGDKILKIDSRETQSMGVDTAVKLIRGPKGTHVVLTILRDGEQSTREISVTRDVINIPTIQTELRTDGIFVIELYNFSALSADLFRDALREFTTTSSDKLIIDLRGNPGGYLGAAVEISSWFLPTGDIVVTEDYGKEGSEIIHRSRGYNLFSFRPTLKVVILVDRGSASASEIVAGALKQHDMATVVGTHTFGKGSVQELINITSTTRLKLTVARWLTPDGTTIPLDGIAPDVEVTVSDEDIEAGRDPQLDKAVELLLQ